ncbi:MAG: Asp-tRNA(Asn)/Glu-tRNA(Gln) amidotransferase subunit GatC [Elusimicrobiota bacterium]
MKINKKDVDYVARLARLELTEEEKEKYAVQLGSILEYIDQLNKLDTGNVPPTSHVLDLKNVWRKDKAKQSSGEEIEKLLGNAPEREDNFFKVKKVIE